MTTFFDRVKEFAGSSGTGPFSLPGTAIVPGFRGFAATLAEADQPYYCARLGSAWEVGLGTWDATAEEMQRSVLVTHTGSPTPVDFASAPVVYTVIEASLMNQIFAYFQVLVQILGTISTDESGNLTHYAAIADASAQYIDAAEGFDEIIPDNVSAYVLRAGAPLSSGSLQMPDAPINGQQVYINCNYAVGALTHTAALGNTLENPMTSFDGVHGAIYIFYSAIYTWVRLV